MNVCISHIFIECFPINFNIELHLLLPSSNLMVTYTKMGVISTFIQSNSNLFLIKAAHPINRINIHRKYFEEGIGNLYFPKTMPIANVPQ